MNYIIIIIIIIITITIIIIKFVGIFENLYWKV